MRNNRKQNLFAIQFRRNENDDHNNGSKSEIGKMQSLEMYETKARADMVSSVYKNWSDRCEIVKKNGCRHDVDGQQGRKYEELKLHLRTRITKQPK